MAVSLILNWSWSTLDHFRCECSLASLFTLYTIHDVRQGSTFTEDFTIACIASPRIRVCKRCTPHTVKIFFPPVFISNFQSLLPSFPPLYSIFATRGGEQRKPCSYGSHAILAGEPDCVLFLAHLFYLNSANRSSTSIVHNLAASFPQIFLDIEAFAQHGLISCLELVIQNDMHPFTSVLKLWSLRHTRSSQQGRSLIPAN